VAQLCAAWEPLATALHQVGPNTGHNTGNIAEHEASSMPKKVGNTSENARFDDFGLGR
jgi:hypothetical protein